MDDLVDMIVSDGSPSQIADRIKDILFAKSAERVDAAKPYVASSLFGEEGTENYEDEDSDNEYEEDEEEV
jgi:hypothetical protein